MEHGARRRGDCPVNPPPRGSELRLIVSYFVKPQQLEQIRQLLTAGVSQRETARRVGVSKNTVRRYVAGQASPHDEDELERLIREQKTDDRWGDALLLTRESSMNGYSEDLDPIPIDPIVRLPHRHLLEWHDPTFDEVYDGEVENLVTLIPYGSAGHDLAEHGSTGMYLNHGCRCEVCREWNSSRQAAYRQRRRNLTGSDRSRQTVPAAACPTTETSGHSA